MPSLWSVVFCTRVAWVCLLLYKEKCSSPVSAITERRDMVSLSVLANFHVCGIMLLLRAILNASPRGHMCFRCLIFSMSGPYELLFKSVNFFW